MEEQKEERAKRRWLQACAGRVWRELAKLTPRAPSILTWRWFPSGGRICRRQSGRESSQWSKRRRPLEGTGGRVHAVLPFEVLPEYANLFIAPALLRIAQPDAKSNSAAAAVLWTIAGNTGRPFPKRLHHAAERAGAVRNLTAARLATAFGRDRLCELLIDDLGAPSFEAP